MLHRLPLADARAAWTALDDASPLATPFSSVAMLEAAEAAFGRARVLLVEEDGRAVAAAALFPRRRFGLDVALAPPLTFYAPVLLAETPDAARTHARTSPLDALAAAAEAEARVLLWTLPPALADARTLRWRGWTTSLLHTYVLDLSAEGDVAAGWSSGARRRYARDRATLDVREDASALPEIAALLEARYVEQGKRLMPRGAALVAYARALVDAGVARVWAARNAAGDVQGGLVVLHRRARAHYWLAASRPGPAMTCLVGDACRALRDAGATAFDLGGANTPSIAEFKRRFGARLVPYVRALHTRPRLLGLHPALHP